MLFVYVCEDKAGGIGSFQIGVDSLFTENHVKKISPEGYFRFL